MDYYVLLLCRFHIDAFQIIRVVLMDEFLVSEEAKRVGFNPLLLEFFECMSDDLRRRLISFLRYRIAAETWLIAQHLEIDQDYAREVLRQCIDYGMVTSGNSGSILTERATVLLDSLNDGISTIHFQINKHLLIEE